MSLREKLEYRKGLVTESQHLENTPSFAKEAISKTEQESEKMQEDMSVLREEGKKLQDDISTLRGSYNIKKAELKEVITSKRLQEVIVNGAPAKNDDDIFVICAVCSRI